MYPHDDRDEAVRQPARQLSALIGGDAPVARAAVQNVTPTTTTKSSSPAVRSTESPPDSPTRGTAAALRSTKFLNPSDWGEAVEGGRASSTAITATVPGRTGMVGRWSSGLPTTMRPVSRLRLNGASRDTVTLYTSKGSASGEPPGPEKRGATEHHHGVDQDPPLDRGSVSRSG